MSVRISKKIYNLLEGHLFKGTLNISVIHRKKLYSLGKLELIKKLNKKNSVSVVDHINFKITLPFFCP